eukprot:7528586-Pyramimonas_sp.AAC.1
MGGLRMMRADSGGLVHSSGVLSSIRIPFQILRSICHKNSFKHYICYGGALLRTAAVVHTGIMVYTGAVVHAGIVVYTGA